MILPVTHVASRICSAVYKCNVMLVTSLGLCCAGQEEEATLIGAMHKYA